MKLMNYIKLLVAIVVGNTFHLQAAEIQPNKMGKEFSKKIIVKEYHVKKDIYTRLVIDKERPAKPSVHPGFQTTMNSKESLRGILNQFKGGIPEFRLLCRNKYYVEDLPTLVKFGHIKLHHKKEFDINEKTNNITYNSQMPVNYLKKQNDGSYVIAEQDEKSGLKLSLSLSHCNKLLNVSGTLFEALLIKDRKYIDSRKTLKGGEATVSYLSLTENNLVRKVNLKVNKPEILVATDFYLVHDPDNKYKVITIELLEEEKIPNSK